MDPNRLCKRDWFAGMDAAAGNATAIAHCTSCSHRAGRHLDDAICAERFRGLRSARLASGGAAADSLLASGAIFYRSRRANSEMARANRRESLVRTSVDTWKQREWSMGEIFRNRDRKSVV